MKKFRQSCSSRLSFRAHFEISAGQAQMAELFLTDRSVITKYLRNIFQSKELEQKSNVQKMHIPNSDKPVQL